MYHRNGKASQGPKGRIEKVESKSVGRLWDQLGGQRNRAEGRGAPGENKRGETRSTGTKLQIQEEERENPDEGAAAWLGRKENVPKLGNI